MLGFNPACWKYNFFYGGLMSEVRTKGADEKFCESCGEIIKQAAEICPKCGVRQKNSPFPTATPTNYQFLKPYYQLIDSLTKQNKWKKFYIRLFAIQFIN